MIFIDTRFCNLHRDATCLQLRQTSNGLNNKLDFLLNLTYQTFGRVAGPDPPNRCAAKYGPYLKWRPGDFFLFAGGTELRSHAAEDWYKTLLSVLNAVYVWQKSL